LKISNIKLDEIAPIEIPKIYHVYILILMSDTNPLIIQTYLAEIRSDTSEYLIIYTEGVLVYDGFLLVARKT
jgi:hypothetical protein